jgi:hypothetical protein
MMKSHANLTEFTAQAMEDGFDEVVQKEWAPNLAVGSGSKLLYCPRRRAL